MHARVRLFVAALALAAAAIPAAVLASAEQERLVGSVGPGFTISLTRADGTPVSNLQPGAYDLEVTDQGENHNFHLSGPGVDVATGVEFTGQQRFAVNLVDGSYRFVCDVHPTTMRGTFTVGAAQPPPPPPPPPAPPPLLGTLSATVGPGASIALRRGGRAVKIVEPGPYLVVVRDRSARDNFHLIGPGVNRRTGVAARATARWRVRLLPGRVYRYRSDSHPALRGSFRTRAGRT